MDKLERQGPDPADLVAVPDPKKRMSTKPLIAVLDASGVCVGRSVMAGTRVYVRSGLRGVLYASRYNRGAELQLRWRSRPPTTGPERNPHPDSDRTYDRSFINPLVEPDVTPSAEMHEAFQE